MVDEPTRCIEFSIPVDDGWARGECHRNYLRGAAFVNTLLKTKIQQFSHYEPPLHTFCPDLSFSPALYVEGKIKRCHIESSNRMLTMEMKSHAPGLRHRWPPEALNFAKGAKKLPGQNLEQLVVKLQRITGNPRRE